MADKRRIRACEREMLKLAKTGKWRGKYTVYASELNDLLEEGFSLKFPKGFQCSIAKRAPLVQVALSWENPATTAGLAMKCAKTAEDFYVRKHDRSQHCAKASKCWADTEAKSENITDEELVQDFQYGEDADAVRDWLGGDVS